MSDLTAQVLLPPTRCRHASLPEFTIEATRFCGSRARSIQDEANLQQHHPLGRDVQWTDRTWARRHCRIDAPLRREGSACRTRTIAALRTGRGAPSDAIVRAGHIEGRPLAAVPAIEII